LARPYFAQISATCPKAQRELALWYVAWSLYYDPDSARVDLMEDFNAQTLTRSQRGTAVIVLQVVSLASFRLVTDQLSVRKTGLSVKVALASAMDKVWQDLSLFLFIMVT
jgi:hypothetical protein